MRTFVTISVLPGQLDIHAQRKDERQVVVARVRQVHELKIWKAREKAGQEEPSLQT
jgi:hypothetical protein